MRTAPRQDRQVIVVGAGAAGIAAARYLKAHRMPCLVLEASRRLGGRARTDTATFGLPVDLGAHWFHSPGVNPLRALADGLGFPYARTPLPERWQVGTSDPRAEHACARAVAEGFARVAAVGASGRDVAAADCVDRNAPWRAAFDAAFTAKQGVAPAAASSLDFARYTWDGPDLPVTGGYGALLAQLGAGLPVHYDTPVTDIRWRGPETLEVGGHWGRLRAGSVIMTASTGVLASGLIRFTPALPAATVDALAQLPMGHGNKLVLKAARHARGDLPPGVWMFADGAADALELVTGPAESDVVVAVASGEFGRDLAAAGAAAFRAQVADRLRTLLGTTVALAPGQLLADWDADPFARGYVASARPGGAGARGVLATPVNERLLFAGEACSAVFMGDVHGAWESGEAAALAALKVMGSVLDKENHDVH